MNRILLLLIGCIIWMSFYGDTLFKRGRQRGGDGQGQGGWIILILGLVGVSIAVYVYLQPGVISNCADTTPNSDGTCTSCDTGYTTSADNKTCDKKVPSVPSVPSIPNCADTTPTPGKCKKCKTGYKGNTCTECDTNSNYSKGSDNKTCVKKVAQVARVTVDYDNINKLNGIITGRSPTPNSTKDKSGCYILNASTCRTGKYKDGRNDFMNQACITTKLNGGEVCQPCSFVLNNKEWVRAPSDPKNDGVYNKKCPSV